MSSVPAGVARRPRTATSRAGRARAGARIWCPRLWPRPPRSPATSRCPRICAERALMESVRRGAGRALPLGRADVDPDQIIPSHWLKRIERTGYAPGLFEAWRTDPSFVMNDARYRGAAILLAGRNFGSGSSREHAAWALLESGFRAVIAPRFADIFRSNALKNGLVPVELPDETVTTLVAAVERDPTLEIAIDVERRTVTAPAAGVSATFPLDDHARQRLLEGLDDIALTLRHERDIAAYEARGPYRYVRNPMYIGVLTSVLGIAIAYASAWVLAYAVLVAIAFHFFVLGYEEPTLEDRFGASYPEYRRTVPRWVPRAR